MSEARRCFGSEETHARAVWLAETGDADGAIAELRRVLRKYPNDAAARSYLLLLRHYRAENPAALFAEHIAWARKHAGIPAQTGWRKKPGSPVRIGYVSPQFRELNPVLSFIEPVLRAHDRQRFRVICYSDVAVPDSGTHRARAFADKWRDISGADDAEAAARIRGDRIDILVDLAGHLPGNRLLMFATKPAPVQVTWIGYPDTTGLQTMDYRLTDAIADPPGLADKFHTERLIRLDNGFLCYQPPPESPAVSALPAWFASQVTFGCFQYPAKITSGVIECWAEIMRRTPRSRLLLHHCFSDYSLAPAPCRDRITAEFAPHGIHADRLQFAGPLPSREHLELYGLVDLMLDTFPYNGTTSICESLWMGVPVVTVEGSFHAGRVGSSLLTRVGLRDWVAVDNKGYVELAAAMAQDLERLAQLRASLRRRMQASPLLDPVGFTDALETSYLAMAKAPVRSQNRISNGGAALPAAISH